MKAPQPIPPSTRTQTNTDPGFGKTFSSHMLLARYEDGAWGKHEVRPFARLALAPTTSALHYGQSVFEGMKAYRTADDTPCLFRPQDHFLRINRSARRLCMPELPEALFMGGIVELLRRDAGEIPREPDRSLYVRPVYFATDESIGLRVSERYMFVVMGSPVGAYHAKQVSLLLSRDNVRSHIGGTGDVKTAGNYGASLDAALRARQQGWDDVLWVDAESRENVEECGTMNVFFVFDDVVVTPPLTGTILPGVTRDSVLQLLAAAGQKVEQRQVPITELIARHDAGQLRGCFGTGTAASIAPVVRIGFEGRDLVLPPVDDSGVAARMHRSLTEIRRGTLAAPAGWIWKL